MVPDARHRPRLGHPAVVQTDCRDGTSTGTEPRATCPAIAGVHLEGPFITVPGAHGLEHIRTSVESVWVSELDPAVRVVTLAPELPGSPAGHRAAQSKRLSSVSLGHSACSAEQAHAAADAGARLVTHLGNATGPFHQRSPGLLGAALADERLAVSLIADLEHVHPDLLRIGFAAKGPGRVVLVTDSVATEAGMVGPVVFHRDPGARAVTPEAHRHASPTGRSPDRLSPWSAPSPTSSLTPASRSATRSGQRAPLRRSCSALAIAARSPLEGAPTWWGCDG